MSRILALLFLLVTFGVPRTAYSYSVTFCFVVETSFVDLEGGDYWTTDDARPLRGIWVNLWDNSTSASVSGYPKYAGVDGCTTATLSGGTHSYDVSVSSKIEVYGQQVNVYHPGTVADDPADDGVLTYLGVEDDFTPTANATREVTVPWDRQSSAVVIAGRVLSRTNGWNWSTSLPIEIFVGSSGCGLIDSDTTNYEDHRGDIRCSDANLKRRFVVAHEIGHAIAYRREAGEHASCAGGCDAAELNGMYKTNAATNFCDGAGLGAAGKGRFVKEYQSTAAREGWADFVAAAAWNDPGETDCEFHVISPSDLDLDEYPEDPGFPGVSAFDDNPGLLVSCEGTPVTSAVCDAWDTAYGGTFCNDDSMAGPNNKDWLADMIAYADPMGCDAPDESRGTQFDWLRFWWDMYTDQGVGLPELTALMDNMDQRSWDPDSSASGDGDAGTSDDVIVRLEDAADSTICVEPSTYCTSRVDAEKDNGQTH